MGKTRADLPKNTALGKAVRGRAVPNSREIERIAGIPRRKWREDPDLEFIIEHMSDWLRKPGSTATFLPVQAFGLYELWMYRGLVGWLPVGTGKTLTSFVAQVVLGSKRELLLVPANLMREKTPKELEHYRKDWDIPEFRVMSYESLSRKDGEDKIRAYEPDLIVADEAHRLKNRRSARTRKLGRYMEDHPDCVFVPLTGTPLGGGLKGAAHLFEWALPPELRPFPEKWPELSEWADALDFKVPSVRRLAPGALTRFCDTPEEASSIDGVRSAMGRRYTETPGIVTDSYIDCAASISIEGHILDTHNQACEDAFDGLHKYSMTPDEHTFAEASQSWAFQHEFALGFFYRWNPRAPKEWMAARKDWHAQCRDILANNKRDLDSELMVANAIDRGFYESTYLNRWRELRPTFTPNPESVWFDDTSLDFCANWMEHNAGICWVYHRDFGTRLSERTGVPFYRGGGLDPQGNSIEFHKAGKPLIASLESNKFGRNLQHFDRNLVTYWPPTADSTEQMMGRTHRRGQESDHVSFEVLIRCRVQWDNINKARLKARNELQGTTIQQKILLADYLVPDVDTKTGQRWR